MTDNEETRGRATFEWEIVEQYVRGGMPWYIATLAYIIVIGMGASQHSSAMVLIGLTSWTIAFWAMELIRKRPT